MAENHRFYIETITQARTDREKYLKQAKELEKLIATLEDYLQRDGVPAESFSITKRFERWTQIDSALQVLKEKGDWMHTEDIAAMMIDGGIGGDIDTLKRSLYGSLSRREGIVKHPKKQSTFGFDEWIKRDNLEVSSSDFEEQIERNLSTSSE